MYNNSLNYLASKGDIVPLFELVTCPPSTSSLMSDVWNMSAPLNVWGKPGPRLEGTLCRWSFDGFEISLKPNGSRCAVILNQCWKVTTLINCIYANGRAWFTAAIKSEEWGSSLLSSAISSYFLSHLSAAPRSVPAPSRVRSINGSSVEVAWDEPMGVRGVIEKYILRACPEGGGPGPPHTPCVTSELVHTSNLTGKGDSSWE